VTTSTIDTDTIKRAAAKRWPEILSTLGNCPGELLDGGYGTRPNGEPQIVATYDYRDEAGELVFQVVRYEPKDFRQRKPKDGGGCDVGQGGRVARTVREGRRVRLVAGRWHGRGVNAAG